MPTPVHSGLELCDPISGSAAIDPVIGAYRWAVLGSHAIVFLYFYDTDRLTILTRDVEPLCWPYFQNCWLVRFDTLRPVIALLLIQFGLIIATALALAYKRYSIFWILMVSLNVYLFLIISLDYRFRSNELYMLFWSNIVFLVWPAKRWAIPLILISFYFWAGTLKLNYEWLSGSVLYHKLYLIPTPFTWIACVYVVILEMIMIGGLLAERAWVRWLVLAQLALFHLESISQIGWFYPLLMVTLLSWFLVDWTTPGHPRLVSLARLWRGRAPRSAYALLAVFAVFQLAPYIYHGNEALTGQGRIFALHMFETQPVCDVHAVVYSKNQKPDIVNLLMPNLPPRVVCDPLIYYDRLANLCRTHATDPDFMDADFVMHARRATDTSMTTVVDETNFCSRHQIYRVFSNNRWIR